MRLDEKWRCDECGRIHADRDEAHECCAPQVSAGYQCPKCDAFHREMPDALDCCGYDPDAPKPPPAADEIEAAGQQRLLP
jgi:hypothetical protein